MTETLLSGETVFEGKIINVRVDTVGLANGGRAVREVVEHRPAVVLVPLDTEGNVILVRQYRYAAGEMLLEAPAGIIEESESPIACAQRELQEETGYRSEKLEGLGEFWTTPGFCDERMYAYLATELKPSRLEADQDEDIAVERFPVSSIRDMILRGEIQDAKTIAALLIVLCQPGHE